MMQNHISKVKMIFFDFVSAVTFAQVPVFDRTRFNLKFRHRSFQRYRSHQKIFTELGDTAPQSWTDFGNFRKILEILLAFQGFWWENGY